MVAPMIAGALSKLMEATGELKSTKVQERVESGNRTRTKPNRDRQHGWQVVRGICRKNYFGYFLQLRQKIWPHLIFSFR